MANDSWPLSTFVARKKSSNRAICEDKTCFSSASRLPQIRSPLKIFSQLPEEVIEMTFGFCSWSYCKNVAQVRCIRQSDVAQICLADNFTVEEIAHKHYTTKQRIQYSFIGLASERLDQFIPGRLKIIEELSVHAACWVERFWMLVEKTRRTRPSAGIL